MYGLSICVFVTYFDIYFEKQAQTLLSLVPRFAALSKLSYFCKKSLLK